MNQLQQQVVQWAREKGLLTDVTPERIEKQSLKVLEEIGETAGAYLKGNREELIDGIGDIAVTLVILGAMKEHTIGESWYKQEDQMLLLSVSECLLFYCQEDDNKWLNIGYNHLEMFAKSQGLQLHDCLQSAYDVIARRTGKMVNGTFIKD